MTATATIDMTTYAQVQAYYAHQMQLLDSDRTEQWAQTFAEDGVFAADAHPEPTVGRDAIAAAATRARAALREKHLKHRHWLGMVSVTPAADGGLLATSYALIIETPAGGSPTARFSTSCEDVLVPAPEAEFGWQVKHRQVRRDDLIEY